MSAIAFTKRPAIVTKGFAFAAQEKSLSFTDEVKYRIVAPAMIPMDIYRYDEGEEYEVVFSSEVIDQIHQKFMSNYSVENAFNFNLEHNPNKKVPAYILECWIVENEDDKAITKYGIDVPIGTLMLTTQITDKDYYTELVSNGQLGYSIEGFFGISEIINKKIKNKMRKKNFNSGVGAYLDLPVGTWTIGDKVYTVVEVVENEGTDDEYRRNVIESMVPVSKTEDVEEVALTEEEVTEEKEVEASEEVTEEEVTEEEKVEATETTEEEKEVEEVEAADETVSYTKEEVDAKLDALMEEIAALASKIITKDAPATEEVKVEMSAMDRLSVFSKFSNQR